MRRSCPRGLALASAALLVSSAVAQPPDYDPDPAPPAFDTMHFPSGSDTDTFASALDSLSEFGDSQDIGLDAGAFPLTSAGAVKKHPWYGGRNPQESDKEWRQESKYIMGQKPKSLKRFMQCFEPRLVASTCPYCQPSTLTDEDCDEVDNSGFIWEYWWPEYVIETNNFGITSFNPVIVGKNNYLQKLYNKHANQFAKLVDTQVESLTGVTAASSAIPGDLRKQPHLGNTHFAGLLPWDNETFLEAHVYRTNVAWAVSKKRPKGKGFWGTRGVMIDGICEQIDFWYNGYKKGNHECFYDTTPQKTSPIGGFTEHIDYSPFWRFPELSKLLDPQKYQASRPNGLADGSYWQERSCASYRAAAWPGKYGDLQAAVGIHANSDPTLRDICYRGGGQLYPVVGVMETAMPELVMSAYLARRAIELLARRKKKAGQGVPLFADRNRKGDSIDKLQRIS
ncbi:MAG: hypothetical protein KDD44_11580, partial [Bdellovibrionales bacterium]|nr:hypothetical protein [Bdellovibrionales bacterium]